MKSSRAISREIKLGFAIEQFSLRAEGRPQEELGKMEMAQRGHLAEVGEQLLGARIA